VNHKLQKTAVVLILLLVVEGFSRWQLHRMFNQPYTWSVSAPYLRYGIQRSNILGARSMVFGGSTVCPDTLRLEYQGNQIISVFCDPCEALPKPCFNAAAPALTIVDSWYLYDTFSGLETLEYVFFLNGINDARSNNIPKEQYNQDYRHIQFYDEAAIIFGHPELSFWSTPTLIHLAINRMKGKTYLPMENLQKLNSEDKGHFLKNGKEVKTIETFSNKMKAIVDCAEKRNHRLIVGTFPYYHPENYTLESFIARELDYKESIFMTEMYGNPKDVVTAIEAHNDVLRNMAATSTGWVLLDIDSIIPKKGEYFNDICHLASDGCSLLNHSLARSLKHEELK